MDKKIFRKVGILIAVSLIALAGLQAVWLVKMYRDMNTNFSRQVNAALEKAAYDELISRHAEPSVVEADMVRNRQLDNDSLTQLTIDTINFRNISGSIAAVTAYSPETIHNRGGVVSAAADSSRVVINIDDLIPGAKSRNIMVFNLPARSQMPSEKNVLVCDSLFGENLLVAGITRPYRFTLRDNETGEEMVELHEQVTNGIEFTLGADSRDRSSYVVTISNPNRAFLGEMAGILISSVLIILLIAVVFRYLLRTLFKQKTLEKMRLDLTHNITHELKTPIAVASAAGEALVTFGLQDDPGKRDRYLSVIRDQLGNLSDMVENILAMSLFEQDDYRLDLDDHPLLGIVQEQVRALSLTDTGRVSLNIDIPADLKVFCDRRHFAVVVKNLLDNAVKYSLETAEVEVSAYKENGRTVIRVLDRGIGIPKSSIGRIFEKFYRVPTGDRHDVKGFGLGLYYVKDMVGKHGGTITVDSREGKGTTFTIILPEDRK